MEDQTSFDLNAAIRKWRRDLAQSPAFRRSDLDELETHLRDAIPGLQAAGLSVEESFLIASRRIGGRHTLEPEFRKVNAARVWLNRPWQTGLRIAMVFMILSLIGVENVIDTLRRQAISDVVVEPTAWFVFPGTFGAILVAMAVLGGIGYVVLRAVSKSGSERLASTETWPQEKRR